ncbi:MAG TPA: hypothetical protein VMW55_02205 [Nitrosopumilaceae archaeon]|nr:hypothetical protein [Nitrosopumilaceae archaeon]
MALVEPIKKGGRYTRKEQEERKLRVLQLHFEEKKSAVKIAEELKINRNTINDDIQFWYGQLASKSSFNSSNRNSFSRNYFSKVSISVGISY